MSATDSSTEMIFKDHAQNSFFKARSLRLRLDLERFDVLTRNSDGEWVSYVEFCGRDPIDTAAGLIGFLNHVKGHGLGSSVVEDMVSAIKDRCTYELRNRSGKTIAVPVLE